MQTKKKELGENIIVDLDKKNYDEFLNKIKELGKKYENKSNPKKLNYSVVFNGRRKPYENVRGWCSRVLENSGRITEVIFIDYDCILLPLVKEELRYIMDKYKLSPFYIFKTHEEIDEKSKMPFGNYICISITKKTFKEVGQILDELHCDRSYRAVPREYKYKTYVLRLGKKFDKDPPKFREIVGDLDKEYSQDCSEAHLKVINDVYTNTKNLIKYTNLDGNHRIFTSDYMTASK